MKRYEATMTSKGQVTVPIEVRRRLGLVTGSMVLFVETEGGGWEVRSPLQQLEANFGRWQLPEGMTTLEAIRLAREELVRDSVDHERLSVSR